MKGKCYYCKKEFAKTGILRHLKSCEKMKEFTGSDNHKLKNAMDNFILSIAPKYGSTEYWLFILADKNATLRDLDKFLRDVWLECCGHLSSFQIGGQSYDSQINESWGWGKPSRDMNVRLKSVLRLDDKIAYEYDFGSTTHLDIRVVGELSGGMRQKKIEIMARNNAPAFSCSECGERAEYFSMEDEKNLCSECLGDREDMILELGDANSPRSGVCGYTGHTDDEADYLPETSKTHENVIPFKKETVEEDKPSFSQKDITMLEDALLGLRKMSLKSRARQEAKKWGAIDKNFSLDYHLGRLTKDELLNIANNLHMEAKSSLKKDEIKTKILEQYKNRANYVLENMDTERFQFLLNIAKQNGYCIRDIAEDWNYNYYRDMGVLFTGYMDREDVVIMPQEFHKILLEKTNSAFDKHLSENEELIKLFFGMCYFYGVISLDDFKKLVLQYIEYDISNRNLKDLIYDAAYYYDEFNFDGYFGSYILVDNVMYIYTQQQMRGDLSHYPFSKSELLEATKEDFPENSKPWKRLRSYLVEHYNIKNDEADDLIFVLDKELKNDKPFREVLSNFFESFNFSNINEANEATSEVVSFCNNTRIWVLKGHSPQELAPELQPMERQEKVGRNDPCPCGSGKKYKKCCGR